MQTLEKIQMKIEKYWLETLYIVSILVFVGVYSLWGMHDYVQTMSSAMSEHVVRFHVLANSDTTEDQLLKENVRDAVLDYMSPILKDSPSIEETRLRITAHMQEMQAVAEQVVTNWDKDYSIHIELTHEQFPTKSYGDIIFPEGEYEACRILIGEGKGQNWWCVMYPPLCYVDAATGVIPLEGKEALQEALTPEQYEIVSFQADKPFEFRFKLMEWLD